MLAKPMNGNSTSYKEGKREGGLVETPAGMMKECIREGRPDNVGLTKRRVKLFEYNEKWNHARRLFRGCLFIFKENAYDQTVQFENIKSRRFSSNS